MVATALQAGSLAVIQVNSDNPGGVKADTVSFALLQAIGSGTQIHFTDRTWTPTPGNSSQNAGSFSTSGSDGTYTYTAATNLPAGTIVTISTADLNAAGIDINDAGEAIYVYQGTANAPTSFLYALELGDGNTGFGASIANTGLTAGTHTVALAGDNLTYGDRGHNIQVTDLLGRIGNSENWSNNDNSPQIPLTGDFFSAPDQVVWAAHPGPGGISHFYRDGTAAATQQVTSFENPATPTEHFYHPNDIVFDTAHGLFFVADSDQGNRRILQGNIADLNNPGAVPPLKVIYQDNDPTTAGGQFNGIAIDVEHGNGVGALYFVNKGNFNRVTYDHDGTTTQNQTPTLLAQLPAGSFANEIALDIASNRAWIVSTASHTAPYEVPAGTPGAQYDPDSGTYYKIGTTISNNEIWQVSGLDRADTSNAQTTLSKLDLDASVGGVQDLPNAQGLLQGIDFHAGSNTLYFVTQQWAGGTEGVGGVYTLNLTNNVITNVYAETTATDYAFEYIDIDPVTGRFYVSNVSYESPGDPNGTSVNTSSIFSGVLGSGILTQFARTGNINGSATLGLITLNAPTQTSTANTGLSVTEASSLPGSGFTSPIALIATLDVTDGDTANLVDQLAGAQMRISGNYLSGAGHQDRLTINGATDGDLTYGSKTIAFAWDATHGVMTLTGPATFDNYEDALKLIRFSTIGDNITDYGSNNTRAFAWSVFDGALYSDEVTATVSVTGINDAPVNAVGAAASATEDGSGFALTGISVSDVDADPANQEIRVTLAVAEGELTIRTDVAGGIAAGDITAGGNGQASITLTATQNQINATLAAANGLRYTPNANVNGTDQLTVTSNDLGLNGSDPGLSGTAASEQDQDIKVINISAVNDAPDLTPNAPGTVGYVENAAPTALLAGGTVTDAADIGENPGQTYAGGSFSVAITSGAVAGDQIVLLAASGFSVVGSDLRDGSDQTVGTIAGLGTNSVTVSALTSVATPSVVNQLVEAFGFQSISDSPTNADRTVTFTFNDGGNTGSGGGLSDSVTQTIQVTPVNDAPSGADATRTLIEDGAAYTFAASDFGFSDPDNPDDAFITLVIETLPGAGQLTLGGAAVSAGQAISAAALGTLVFTPAAGGFGDDYASFTFKVRDGGGTASGGENTAATASTFTFNVTSVNDAPSGADVTKSLDEDAVYVFARGDFGFEDADGDEFEQVILTSAPGAGTIFRDADGAGGAAAVALGAGAVVTVADLDAGLITFAPAGEASGAPYASFTFQVRDDGGTANGGVNTDPDADTFTFNVNAANDGPSLTVPGAQGTDEDTDKVFSNANGNAITVGDPDAGGADLTVTLKVDHGKLTPGSTAGVTADGSGTGTLVLTGSVSELNDALDGLVYAPAANYNGADTLSVEVDDNGNIGGGSLTSSNNIAINVSAADDDPTGITAGTLAVDEFAANGTVVGTVTGQDPDGDSLTYSLITNPGGRFAIDNNGQITVAAGLLLDFEQSASHTVRVRVEDAGAGVEQDFTVDVTNVDPENVTGDADPNKFVGGALADVLRGGGGDDDLEGRGGDDLLVAGAGNDTLDGGAGSDTASYADAGADVSVSLLEAGPQTIGVGEGDDTLTGIENLIGSAQGDDFIGDGEKNFLQGRDAADRLVGGAEDDILWGQFGNDTLDGGAGDDHLGGFYGVDTVTYASAAAGVTVRLGVAGPQNTVGAGTDTLVRVENVIGSGQGDNLSGGTGANDMSGGGGGDTLNGLGGADSLLGGSGADTLNGGALGDFMMGGADDDIYVVSSVDDQVFEIAGEGVDTVRSSVDFDLSAPVSGTAQFADNVTLTGSAAAATGNGLANALVGNAAANDLSGGGGADDLTGNRGRDELSGGLGGDTFHFALGHSGVKSTTADTIEDWSTADSIGVLVAGNSTNYREFATSVTTVEAAVAFAEDRDTDARDYIFLFNETTDTGYLVADLNDNEVFDTAIVLAGAGSGLNFNAADIV